MDISKVSFTGSIAGGRAVQNSAMKSNMKKVTLELGGKSPAIVFDDAPFEEAVAGVGHGFLANSGQICVAASRVLVQEGIAEKLCQALKEIFQKTGDSMGADPLLPSTTHGPIVDKAQYDRIMSYIERGKQSAQLLAGGARQGSKGYFIQPTLLYQPSAENAAYKEEVFGPVLVVKTFKTEEDAIALANDTQYGLAGKSVTIDAISLLKPQ
jgi:aldehyde dehydrogenase (NAD+)